jgi:hypothetical protein
MLSAVYIFWLQSALCQDFIKLWIVSAFQEQGSILKKHLTNRGYNPGKVQIANDDMKQRDRQSLPQYRERYLKDSVPLVTTYHPVLKDLNSTYILRRHLTTLCRNPRMVDVFKDPPMSSLRRPRNLKGMVMRTRLNNPLPNGGFKTCTDLRCQLCKYSSDIWEFQ